MASSPRMLCRIPTPITKRCWLSTSPFLLQNQVTAMDDIKLGKSPKVDVSKRSSDDLALHHGIGSTSDLRPFREMPGPRGLPIIGTLWDYMKKDGFRFNKMFEVTQARSKEFGPVYYEKIMNRASVIVSDPEEYAKVVRADGKYPHRTEVEPLMHFRLKRGLTLGTVNSLVSVFVVCAKVMTTRSKEFGPVYKEKIADRLHVIVSSPDEYSKVVRADGKYPVRIEMPPWAFYRRKHNMPLGTINSQGEEWHRHRSVLSKKMLRPKEVQDYCEAMNDVTNDAIRRMRRVLTPGGHVPNLEHELFKWALESIGTIIFEERIGCFRDPPSQQAQEFIHNLLGFFKLMQPLMYNVPIYKYYPTRLWRQYEQYADKVIEIGHRFVNKRLAVLEKQKLEGVAEGDKVEKSAFLTYLLAQKSLTPEEAVSHAVDLMTGAVETTSNTTLWMLYCLARTPHAQHSLFEETNRVLSSGGQISADTLTELPYVKACLKETFRLYPITFATSRILHEPLELGGYHVPAGSHVQANLYGMGRDPKLFPAPESFQPERWLRDGNDNQLKFFSNLAWGHGPRMCLGRRVAEQEMYILLTKIIQKFHVEYHGKPIEPVLNTVMTPDRPVKLTFINRKGR